MSVTARTSRRGYVEPPSSRFSAHTERAHVGPPPQPSPVRLDRQTSRGVGTFAGRWNSDGTAHAELAVEAATSSMSASKKPASNGASPPRQGSANVPPGTKVLRLSQSPPPPPPHTGTAPAAIATAARAGTGAASALSMASPPPARVAHPSRWDANAAAGMASASANSTRNVATSAQPWGGEQAAGRRFCSLSAVQRKYGGQLDVTGGLG